MHKQRIAVAGAGYIGLAYIGVVQKSPTCTLSAIVDPAPVAEAVAAREAVPLYKSLDELFQKGRPDGVVLATPNQLHLEHALKCIDVELPILLEKPITATVEEAERLVQIVEQRRAKVLIGHHRAHSPIMAKAKQIVDSGGHMWACRMSADMMHLTMDDLYDAVEGIISAADFIDKTDGAQLLFI